MEKCFARFVAGIDKALQIKIHEMGATTFDEALDIAVRVVRVSLIGQTSTSPDHVVASTSSKRDDQLSEVLEKVLHRLDEMELNLGKLQSKSSLHRSPSPRQHQHHRTLMNTNPDQSTDISMISGTNHSDHSVHNDHPVHTDILRHQHRRTIPTLASDRQVLNDPTIVTRISTVHRVHNIISADQAHPDITRTTMADPPAHQDITPKAHRILNGTQHKTSGDPTGNLHNLTVVILITEENLPFIK